MRPSLATAACCVAVAVVAASGLCQAFLLPAAGPSRGATLSMTASSPAPRPSPRALDRRAALQQAASGAALLGLGGALLSLPTPAVAKEAMAAKGATFEESLATLMLAKKVLDPVKRYINIGQFDPARSNINYVKNQFRIKKAMERAVLLAFDKDVDPAKLDEAAEVTAVVDNELIQLDSSVYTQIFIPSEGELNPAAFKYRDQAFGFYDTVMKSIDVVLALGSPADLAAADKLAAKQEKELPKFLFKEFEGDFYRPATP